MTTDDRLEIHNVIARYGHVVDRHPDEFATVFTADVEFDMRPSGGPVAQGIDGILLRFTGSATPPQPMPDDRVRAWLSHHTTNIEITAAEDGTAQARSKFIRIAPDGVRAGTYVDDLVSTESGWRISRRVVLPHG